MITWWIYIEGHVPQGCQLIKESYCICPLLIKCCLLYEDSLQLIGSRKYVVMEISLLILNLMYKSWAEMLKIINESTKY